MTLWLHHHHRTLTVLITVDGGGFDPFRPPKARALKASAIESRVLGGVYAVGSNPGSGTVLTISLPWPARAD